MKLKLTLLLLLLWGCGGSSNTGNKEETQATNTPPVVEASDPMLNMGIGPVKSVTLGQLNQEMADQGKLVYETMCTACHKLDKKFIGPAPIGILERRSPEWIMNMILNPVEMTQNDPIAQQLLIEANGAPMANQNLTEEQARQVLEYFRTL
ncbi:MAG: cytochrome c [Bacteroidetes bacterium]|nr:cytochrome c [Bacteroidota bacterium]MDA1121736.1 cytochrome c [Bacteroidota bacterium]